MAAAQVPEFDDLNLVGMAATLAVHIKGLGEIEYEVLRKVSDHLMSIPSFALEKVLLLLAEVEFVDLVTVKKRIEKIVPKIPRFDDVYERIGEYAENECVLNAHEQATIQILGSLYDSPRSRDSLKNGLGIDSDVFDRVLLVGNKSGITTEQKARGKQIIISPFYFSDNLEGLADAAASAGASALKGVLNKVRDNQGWPISLVQKTQEIGGTKLNPTESALIDKLAREGVLKPPTINFGARSESFVFTPKPGNTRLNAANREVYERAMALVSAVRKGQLLADAYRIRSPVRILESLRDNGFLRSNSEARDQYANLVVLRVATLKQTTPTRWQLHLHRTAENEEALRLAIGLLRTGEMANMEVNQEARIALSKDEKYIQSMIASSEMRVREKQIQNEEAQHEFDQLMLRFD